VYVFDNPAFASAFIGVRIDNRAVYDYNKMVESLMEEEDASYEDAVDWISYNTIRSLPYLYDKAPVIVYPQEEE
jgi:hypothetical protein